MFQTNLKLAWRRLKKNRGFTLVNLAGLALGLAAALAVILYIQDELSYESFHEKAGRIYRANLYAEFDGQPFHLGSMPNALAPFVKGRIPEVEQALRIFPHKYGQTAFIRIGEENFTEERLYWADPNLFDVFSLELQSGRPEKALARANTAVLSTAAAKKFFGNQDPVGQTIKVDNQYELSITGVFESLPPNTHYPFEAIASISTLGYDEPEKLSWGNASFPTFLLLHPQANPEAVEAKIGEELRRSIPEDRQWFSLRLQAMKDIHLHSSGLTSIDEEPYGDIRQVRILSGLAILLLLTACINYMNLSTAKSQGRAKEVGVSKTLGATASRLARQFYAETALLTFFAILIGLLLILLLLPLFNQLSGKALTGAFFGETWFWASMLGIWVLVTALAGLYPAGFLASFTPLDALRRQSAGGGGGNVRKALVVFQFCASTALIIGTIVFYQQLNFIRDKKLGYRPEQVVAVRITGAEGRRQVEALENEVRQLPSVLATALSQTFPGSTASGRSLRRPNAAQGAEGAEMHSCRAHPGIFEVLDIPLLAGKPMQLFQEGDTVTQVVLNRSAVEYLGYSPAEAIGRRVEADLGHAEIVGVAEDFHYGSLHQPIGYYAFHNRRSEWLQYLLVKLNSKQLAGAMQQLEAAFGKTVPGSAFDYTFLDAHLATLYETERRLAKLIFLFAGLAIFVACLGLFALAAFAAEQRTKEIGIRKVLGASVEQLVALISRDFLKLVALSILLAIPLGWWAMRQWLQGFAYRIELQWWAFALSGGIALLIALLTVGFTGYRAARANPVEALRAE
ncbi:MAG: ABC transporter permease [Phaeodactylibacter sp.]|nr:ABC transporter permease [Phaeodactylibacter sp.]